MSGLFCILLASFLLAVTGHGASPLLHDVIGAGYDVLYGNPEVQARKDPGLRAAAIQLTYTQGKKTPDSRHTIPDICGAGTPNQPCSYEGNVRIFFGDASYQEALDKSADLKDAQNWPGRFSLSAGWHSNTNHTKYRSITTSVLAECPIYSVYIRSNSYTVTPAFSKAVLSLPAKYNATAVAGFVKAFGTHFIRDATFGSKTILDDTFAEWDYTELENKVIVDEAAIQNFNSTLLGQGTGSSQFEQYVSSQSVSRFAVPIPRGDPSSTWESRSMYAPVPIKVRLYPITELISPQHFPSANAATVQAKAKLVQTYLTGYCKSTAGCAPPMQDVPALNVSLSVHRGTHTIRAVCPTGMYATSCGNKEPNHAGAFDYHKAIIPNPTGCTCIDRANPMECYALCISRQIPGFQVVTKTVTSGLFGATASCPTGKVVLGCSASYGGESYVERPKYYPSIGLVGSGCHGRGKGLTVYATCAYASHILSHEIVQSAPGNPGETVTATCRTQGNVVLGCGFSARSKSATKFPTMTPSSSFNSCSCSSGNGAYCYAVCGKVL